MVSMKTILLLSILTDSITFTFRIWHFMSFFLPSPCTGVFFPTIPPHTKKRPSVYWMAVKKCHKMKTLPLFFRTVYPEWLCPKKFNSNLILPQALLPKKKRKRKKQSLISCKLWLGFVTVNLCQKTETVQSELQLFHFTLW